MFLLLLTKIKKDKKIKKKMTNYEEVNRLIRIELKKRGRDWTIKKLSKKLGKNISPSWLGRLMKRGELNIKQLFEIAEILDIDPNSLLPDSKNPKPKISFEEYIRYIIRDEFGKLIKNKK